MEVSNKGYKQQNKASHKLSGGEITLFEHIQRLTAHVNRKLERRGIHPKRIKGRDQEDITYK